MGYFVIIIYTAFLGAPPELLPIAFKSSNDCQSYLTTKVKSKFGYMEVEVSNNIKYLSNITNDKFIVCNKLEYPILNTMVKKN